MPRETENIKLALYDSTTDKETKIKALIDAIVGYNNSNATKIDTKTKTIDTNISVLHDYIIGEDGNVVFYNKQEVFLAVHPVGSIFLSTSDVEPAGLYGGTWERIEGKFIMGASDTYPAGSTGGNVTHSHNYGVQAPYYYGTIVGEDGAAFKIADYSSDGSVSMASGYSSGTDTVKVNAQLIASYVDRICTLLKATAKVSYESSLPPYYSVYIWRRIK